MRFVKGLCFLGCWLFGRTNNTEANKGRIGQPPPAFGNLGVPLVPFGLPRPAGSGPQGTSIVFERAAAYSAGMPARWWEKRICRTVANFRVGLLVILIQRPFGHIAQHVVQAPLIGSFLSN